MFNYFLDNKSVIVFFSLLNLEKLENCDVQLSLVCFLKLSCLSLFCWVQQSAAMLNILLGLRTHSSTVFSTHGVIFTMDQHPKQSNFELFCGVFVVCVGYTLCSSEQQDMLLNIFVLQLQLFSQSYGFNTKHWFQLHWYLTGRRDNRARKRFRKIFLQ